MLEELLECFVEEMRTTPEQRVSVCDFVRESLGRIRGSERCAACEREHAPLDTAVVYVAPLVAAGAAELMLGADGFYLVRGRRLGDDDVLEVVRVALSAGVGRGLRWRAFVRAQLAAAGSRGYGSRYVLHADRIPGAALSESTSSTKEAGAAASYADWFATTPKAEA